MNEYDYKILLAYFINLAFIVYLAYEIGKMKRQINGDLK